MLYYFLGKLIPLLVAFVFGGGCFNDVFSNAIAAAACCAFLMDGPDATYSSTSPNFKQTVNDFLCAGPKMLFENVDLKLPMLM